MPDAVIPIDGFSVVGNLVVPGHSTGIVVFVHGSGSSRFSPRNQFVASVLQSAGFATLLFDLLRPAEARQQENVFDIELLIDRLRHVLGWLRLYPGLKNMPIGSFGASTGAAAALGVAADPGSPVSAVVSRGGRPDLALQRLPLVQAPTLLIVGSEDRVVLDLNERAAKALLALHEIRVISGATHLFEEPGALEQVAAAATTWFEVHLGAA